ncbi:MAG: glycosyltransferase [Parachlamydiales bacterium]|nr:glycosyltransferase [Parachlamydiales bacterium]
MAKTMKILMAASNAWNSVFQVGSHHLAREFLKMGHEVAFISDPISPLHLLGGSQLKERFELYQNGGLRDQNLWAYVPATLLPPTNKPFLRSEWVYRYWHQYTFPSVVKKAKANGFGEVDILYFDSPIQSFWLKEIHSRKTVYRMADHAAGFKKATPAHLKLEKELIENVDLVVCTAKNLIDSIQGNPKRVEHLPNGVPLAHFSKPGKMPPEYTLISRPIVLYVGAIEYWFDFELVKKLAKELPQISFVFIGPVKQNRLPPMKNIHFLGPRPYAEIPNYMQCANVGWIPFDVKNYPDLIHNVNPLKLYEYMASGLPVVSTRWKELENIDSPAYLCDGPEEFKTNLLRALNAKHGPVERRFAAGLDWSSRAQQLIDVITR